MKVSANRPKKEKALSYNFNIPELFKSHFGFNVGISTKDIPAKHGSHGINLVEFNARINKISLLGTPVWDFITIQPKIIEATGEKFEGYDFPLECVTEALLPKKIVETDIIGRDGNVEELMGLGDWQLIIRGFVINHYLGFYPEKQVKELKDLVALKDTTLGVESTFLNLLDIYYISLHEIKFPAAVGYDNVQPFEITAKSRIPFTLNPTNGILL